MPSPHISIITPVYGVEDMLVRCLDSMLAQTFEDFEWILIDDGSPDGCGAMLDRYARKDSRMRVIHQQNQGVAVSRNTGLDLATAEFIGFVDPDDDVEPDYLRHLVEAQRLNDADMVVTRFETISVKGEQTTRYSQPERGARFYGRNQIIQLIPVLFDECELGPLWNKLFRASVLEGLRYPQNVTRAGDTVLVCEALGRCQSVQTTDDCDYHYFLIFDGRSITVRRDPKRYLQHLKVEQMLETALVESGLWDERVKHAAYMRMVRLITNSVQMAIRCGAGFFQKVEYVREVLDCAGLRPYIEFGVVNMPSKKMTMIHRKRAVWLVLNAGRLRKIKRLILKWMPGRQ